MTSEGVRAPRGKLLLVALAALMSFWAAVPMNAQTDTPPPDDQVQRLRPRRLIASFGMVGITPSQTARLNLTPLCPTPATRVASNPGPPNAEAHLVFWDGQGNLLAHSTVDLPLDQAAALELDGLDLQRDHPELFSNNRASVRAGLLLPAVQRPRLLGEAPDAAVPPNPCMVRLTPNDEITVLLRPGPGAAAPASFFDVFFDITLEVFDNATGATQFVLENPVVGVGMNPGPPNVQSNPGPPEVGSSSGSANSGGNGLAIGRGTNPGSPNNPAGSRGGN